jgi:hypothetical protein
MMIRMGGNVGGVVKYLCLGMHQGHSMLGFVACRVTSKLSGIGPAERSWGRVKQIEDGKWSYLSGETTEKRSILFVSSKITQAQTHCARMEALDATGHNAMFGDDDSILIWSWRNLVLTRGR